MTEMMENITKFPEIYSVIGALQTEDIRSDAPQPQTISPDETSISSVHVTSPRISHPANSEAIDNLKPIAHLKKFIESVPPSSDDSRICRVRIHSELFDAVRTAGGGVISVSRLVNAILLEFIYNNRGNIKVKDHRAEIEEWMDSANETINKPQ